MDTVVRIKVVHSDSKKAHKAIEAAFAEMERIDGLMNFYNPDSEVSRINRSQGKNVKVNPEVIEVMAASLKYSRLTDGAFDISVAPLLELWDFKDGQHPPDENKINEVLGLVGYKMIGIDKGKKTVRLPQAGMMIDLGGVAKGYAVNRACQVLEDMGISSALIDAGGDIQVIGKKFGHPWKVGVQHPRSKDKILTTLTLNGMAVATSGDYERFFLFDGRRYHHILDPATGYPATGCVSVTITAPSCFVADILSTAVFVLGPEKGMKLIEEIEDVEGIIVTPEGIRFSSGLSQFNPQFLSSLFLCASSA